MHLSQTETSCSKLFTIQVETQMYCHGHPEMFQDILLYQYWLHILLSLSMYTTHCFLALHVFILFPGQWTHFCRQKKRYIVITFGPKSNLSVISPAKRSRSGPNSVYVDMSRADNVQRILGAIGPLCAKWGLGQVPSFLCGYPEEFSATSQRPI